MISVVVPCYNAENVIKRSVGSLLNQGARDYQIVLVDDGSTDSTPIMCDTYALSDSRVKVIHQSNGGLMRAWKRGVIEADGDYIAFCDADDYVDEDLIKKISNVITTRLPDVIIYGMVSEYSDNSSIRAINRLPVGYYNESDIKMTILPHLLSDGSMQSELISKSRWSKVYKKDILMEVMHVLNDSVSLGEDQLTIFAVAQVASSMYCMGDYCPYHYVRTSESMIGRFDRKVFEKVDLLYDEMDKISRYYSYAYPEQILHDKLSVTLLYVKKYLCRSEDGYRTTRKKLASIRNSEDFDYLIAKCSIKKYKGSSRVFAELFKRKAYFILYFLVRLVEDIRGKDI